MYLSRVVFGGKGIIVKEKGKIPGEIILVGMGIKLCHVSFFYA